MEFHSLPKFYLLFSLSILFLSSFQARAAVKISYCGTSSLSLSLLTFYCYYFGFIRSVQDKIRNLDLLLCVLMFDYFYLLILTFHLHNGVFMVLQISRIYMKKINFFWGSDLVSVWNWNLLSWTKKNCRNMLIVWNLLKTTKSWSWLLKTISYVRA